MSILPRERSAPIWNRRARVYRNPQMCSDIEKAHVSRSEAGSCCFFCSDKHSAERRLCGAIVVLSSISSPARATLVSVFRARFRVRLLVVVLVPIPQTGNPFVALIVSLPFPSLARSLARSLPLTSFTSITSRRSLSIDIDNKVKPFSDHLANVICAKSFLLLTGEGRESAVNNKQ